MPPALPFPDDGLQAERRAIEATGGSGSGGGGGGVVGSDGGGSSGDGGGVVFQGHHRKNTVERLYDITRLRPLFFSLHHVFPSACPDIPLWHGTGLHAFLSSSTSSCAPSCVCRSGTTPDVLYVILLPPCACLHVRYDPAAEHQRTLRKGPKGPPLLRARDVLRFFAAFQVATNTLDGQQSCMATLCFTPHSRYMYTTETPFSRIPL